MEKDFFNSRIRLRHIHCFVAVAQEGNLGRAAARLRLTQPAVSKTLVELEELAGARLFERGRQGARLTRDGEAFLMHALPVLEALDAAGKAISRHNAPGARAIHVAALPTVGPDLLPPVITAFRTLYPDARIVLRTAANTALMAMLKGREADVALGRMSDPEMMVGLSFELLYLEPLVIAARPGHPLAALSVPTLAQVLGYPLVVSGKGTVPRHHTETWLQKLGMALPANCIETMSVSIARLLLRQSDALWFTPAGAVRADVADGMLALLNVAPGAAEEAVGLLQRADARREPLIEGFVRLLRQRAAARD